MAEKVEPIEVGNTSELLQVAKEVQRSHTPRVLRHDGEDLAMVVPLPGAAKVRGRGRENTGPDYKAFHASAGSWRGLVDTDQLVDDIYESRSEPVS
jgi:hypothetical protein